MNNKSPNNVICLVPPSSASVNPFRAGSLKALCWERFLRGGDSASIVKDMRSLGAAGSTARTWLCTFRVFARAMREAGRKVRSDDE